MDMRAILIGAAALLLSACSSAYPCPGYVPFNFVSIDATDFMTRHPGSELCLSIISCGTDFQKIVPLDAPATGPTHPDITHPDITHPDITRLDITVRATDGTVLLHATPTVRIHYERPNRGCEASARGDVTIDADGSVTS
jgi:hypothetical protein